MSAPSFTPVLRVLVLDDNSDCADSLSALAVLWGHETRAAHDGPGALAVAAEFRPDVALLDIGLAGMDGCEVARRLRALPGLERVVLAALTGYGDEEHRRQCDGAGFTFYFVKPADLGDLESLLDLLARKKGKRPSSRGPAL